MGGQPYIRLSVALHIQRNLFIYYYENIMPLEKRTTHHFPKL